MGDIDYFEIEYLPGVKHFECSRQRASLSIDSCAENWKQANHDQDVRRALCKGCKIGAAHAGESGASQSPLFGTLTCARCHRPSTRLIRKHLCVSCFNRQREWKIGKNAKGTKPVKLKSLAPRSITFRRAGGEVGARRIDLTLDTDELIIAVLRDERKAVTFGFRGVGPAIDPAELEQEPSLWADSEAGA